MTIRYQLLRAISIGSLLVGFAALGAVYSLMSVGRALESIKSRELPVVTISSQAATCASDLAKKLGDLVDARIAANTAECDELNVAMPATFDAFDEAITEVRRREESIGIHDIQPPTPTELLSMSHGLRQDWTELRSITPESDQWQRALDMDDRASALLDSTLRVQRGAVGTMATGIDDSAPFVRWVVRVAIAGVLVFIGLTCAGGALFTRRLAARLDRVRKEVTVIGLGDLTARVEVLGFDEVDQLATAFNEMAAALEGSRAQLEHDALHDSLTGLPNRALFKERLERRLAEAERHGDFDFAVMFMDLDRFKFVNDSLGHATGDALLRDVAKRIGVVIHDHGVRNGGTNTLARLGGDEFTVLLDRTAGPDDAVAVAELIKETLATPAELEGHELVVTTSVGIAIGSQESRQAKDVMGDADAALYRAKALGRDGHALFDRSMRDEVVERLRVENDLRRAIERREFVLHFQPIIDLSSGQLTGFEALIRWVRDGELVKPDLFIPIAEETGQIVEIGEWVIEEACAQFQRWREAHHGQPRMLSLNVSRRQLVDDNLVPHLQSVLAKTGITPASLIVEITESMLGEQGRSIETIAAIRKLGVLIYVDDFGTGYSTLSCLHRFPLDGIKIDKSFVKKGGVERGQVAVLNTVIQLAHHLHVPVIAEGIETPAQLALLQSMDCDRGQGFHFAKPMTATDAGRMLDQLTVNVTQAA